MLAALVEAYPSAMAARDQAGNLPLHYVAQNKTLTKEILQACGPAARGPRPAAHSPQPRAGAAVLSARRRPRPCHGS